MKIVKVKGKIVDELLSMARSGKIILLNGEFIISRRILESAYLKAERAFNEGTNISRDLGTEIMLYLSGDRQVSRAIEKFGAGKSEINYIIFDGDFNPADYGLTEIEEENNTNEKILEELEKIAIFELKK